MNAALRIEPDGPTSLREWSGLIYAIPDATLTAIGREHGADAIGLFVAPGGTHAALVIEGDELSDAAAGLSIDALTKRGLLPRVPPSGIVDPNPRRYGARGTADATSTAGQQVHASSALFGGT